MRILNFADGFTSASAPYGLGSLIETYQIKDNTTEALFTLDNSKNRSMFVDYELRRNGLGGSFIQSGSFIIQYESVWRIHFGNFAGDDLLTFVPDDFEIAVLESPEMVNLGIDLFSGELFYKSGAMGGSYSGSLKISIVRVQ